MAAGGYQLARGRGHNAPLATLVGLIARAQRLDGLLGRDGLVRRAGGAGVAAVGVVGVGGIAARRQSLAALAVARARSSTCC